MAMDYEKIKRKREDGSHWASYSDLFMVLSVVFLLLYVTTSLRSGTFSIQKHVEYKKMALEAQDLKQQIKVYETLKEDYMENQAKKEDQKVYEQLMDKLTLLQDKNDQEAQDLRAQADENDKKKMALNQYQQIIRNIINANMLSKARIQKRDTIIKKNEEVIVEKNAMIQENLVTISKQDEEIDKQARTLKQKQKIIAEKKRLLATKQLEIQKLEEDIATKQDTINENNTRISQINKELDNKIKSLKLAQKKHNTSRKKMLADIERLKKEEALKVQKLASLNQSIKKQLGSYQNALQTASTKIESERAEREKLSQELSSVEQKLQATQKSYQNQLVKLKSDHNAKMLAEKIAFEKKIESEKMSAAEKERRLAEFKKQADEKNSQLQGKIASLDQKYSEASKELSQTSQQLEESKGKQARMIASIDKLKTEKDTLSKDLQGMKEREEAKKQIVETIKKNFAKAGIKAQVDGKNGEVVLSFGREFFESGSYNLKDGMRSVLENFIPAYTKSLFQDPKVAEKIKNVEIVGHASPTYQGKFVDPTSLDAKDRKAIAYNLDLSIKRAKSIFEHIFDTQKMTYQYQKDLRSMIKVTGRGFFNDGQNISGVQNGMKEKEFCKKYDCKKSQRVIIKFNMKE